MKKLIFIFAVLLFSCQKESCYICTTVYTTTTTGGYASNVQTSSSSITDCSMTENDADKYEKEMTKTATVTSGTTKITTVGRCSCKEQ